MDGMNDMNGWCLVNLPQFSDNMFVLGRYLDPAIDAGSASYWWVVPLSTLCHLTLEEWEGVEHKELRRNFDEQVTEKLGEQATVADSEADDDFDPNDLTPSYDKYKPLGLEGTADRANMIPEPPDEELEPMPEIEDNYLNMSVFVAPW